MDELFRAVREASSAATWSRGVEIVRADAVAGVSEDEDAIELRVDDGRNAMGIGRSRVALGFTVHLFVDDEDWSCTCRTNDDVCAHVAAAVIALRRAREDGRRLPVAGSASGAGKQARVVYRLTGRRGPLVVHRRLLVEGAEIEMPGSITAMVAGTVAGPRVLADEADLLFEKRFGSATALTIAESKMAEVLRALASVDDLAFDEMRQKKVRVGPPGCGLRLRVEQLRDGRFLARLEQDPAITEVFENGAFRMGDVVHAVEAPKGIDDRTLGRLRKGETFAAAEVGRLVGELLPALSRTVPIHLDAPDLPGTTHLRPHVHLAVEREDDLLWVLPTIVYGSPPIARVDGERLTMLDGERGEFPVRNATLERHLVAQLSGLGLEPGLRTKVDPARALALAARAAEGDALELAGAATRELWDAGDLTPRLRVAKDGRAFELSFAGEGTKARADAHAVLRAFERGDAHVPLLEGGFGRVPAEFMTTHGHLVADLLAARETLGGGRSQEALPLASVRDLAALCEALEQPLPPAFSRLRTLLEDFSGIPAAELPGDLRAELRTYQRHGVDWLVFLRDAELGALLADDMGLGKTLQALCAVRGRTLVVAPTSVLHNWRAEANRFRPSLRVDLYHGGERELAENADLTLTSYGLLRQDIDVLAAVSWDSIVLDEAQTIKNPESKVARAAYRLEGNFKLAMTGTPVENRLEDLWSQFNFLARGFLGGRTDFHDRYVRAIAQGEADAAGRLRERIRPFVLRRSKSEVAGELPPRTDVVLSIELGPEERRIYDAGRAATKRDLVERLSTGHDTLRLLEALLRLRQAACHGALLPGGDGAGRPAATDHSPKTRVLMDTLDEVVSAGHKALVFSQWTSFLDIVEHQLRASSLAFCRLDGSTVDRAGVVTRFQGDPETKVMLLSLKAGGVGLNLTAADHVFLLDPWWNPAVEDQAADRAHRIGQDKPVLVHRLVTRDSVEERILALQAHKRELADSALGDAAGTHAITRDELLALLD